MDVGAVRRPGGARRPRRLRGGAPGRVCGRMPGRGRGRAGVVAALAASALVVSGCTASSGELPAAREGRSGLQGTGTVDGRQVAVGTGLPELVVDACDPQDGPDRDVCFLADTIDGRSFVLTVENPDVLAEGASLPVDDPACGTPPSCDDVTDAAIVEVKVGTAPAVRATGGTLTVERLVPFTNYRGEVSLRLPDGTFTGTFDVVPRPDE